MPLSNSLLASVVRSIWDLPQKSSFHKRFNNYLIKLRLSTVKCFMKGYLSKKIQIYRGCRIDHHLKYRDFMLWMISERGCQFYHSWHWNGSVPMRHLLATAYLDTLGTKKRCHMWEPTPKEFHDIPDIPNQIAWNGCSPGCAQNTELKLTMRRVAVGRGVFPSK